ncbi:MAG: MFS transporter, partial [Pedobacter sp.]
MTCLFLICFTTTRERIHPQPGQKTRLKEDLGKLLANHHWLLMFSIALFDMIFICIRGNSLLYYAEYFMGLDKKQAAVLLLAGNA